MNKNKIWKYAFGLSILNIIICIFIGLSDFIINKEVIIFFLGLACFLFGISDLSFLYDLYTTLKKENRGKEVVYSELLNEIVHTSTLKRGLGELGFGLVLIVVYLLITFGIAKSS